MTSRGQCPRGGGGGVLVNVFTPLQEILYPRLGRGGGHELCCPGARPGSRRHWIHGDTWGYMGIYIYISWKMGKLSGKNQGICFTKLSGHPVILLANIILSQQHRC